MNRLPLLICFAALGCAALCRSGAALPASETETETALETGPSEAPALSASRQHASPLSGPQRLRAESLRRTADSITRWHAAHAGDSLADNLASWWTDERTGAVVVRLLRADSAARDGFRRRVHDSPLIRFEGFDPDTEPFPPVPEGPAPPAGISLRAESAFYPPGTEFVRLTIRCRSDQSVWFGTEYTLSRFRHGRWEVLPVQTAWNAVLIGLGGMEPAPPDGRHPAPPEGYAYDFPVWLAPRVFPARYGRYRVSKRVRTGRPEREYLLETEFTVTPLILFGPYTEPDWKPFYP